MVWGNTMQIQLPEWFTTDAILFFIAVLSAIAGVIAWFRKTIAPTLKELRYITEDWKGVPDRPGVVGRPGVMQSIEDIRKIASEALYHSKPNGGNSAYDHLSKKVDDRLDEVREDVASIQSDTSVLISTLADHTNALADNMNTITDLDKRMMASEKDRKGIHRAITLLRVGGTDSHYESEPEKPSSN